MKRTTQSAGVRTRGVGDRKHNVWVFLALSAKGNGRTVGVGGVTYPVKRQCRTDAALSFSVGPVIYTFGTKNTEKQYFADRPGFVGQEAPLA